MQLIVQLGNLIKFRIDILYPKNTLLCDPHPLSLSLSRWAFFTDRENGVNAWNEHLLVACGPCGHESCGAAVETGVSLLGAFKLDHL